VAFSPEGSLTQKKGGDWRTTWTVSGALFVFDRGPGFDQVGDLDLSQVTAQTGPNTSGPGKTKVAK